MTNKEALQSLTEYENDNLLDKLLLDRGLATGGTYAAGNEKDIDLAAASLYFTLAAHPEFKEGSFAVKYGGQKGGTHLIMMAKMILQKYDMDDKPTVNGEAIW